MLNGLIHVLKSWNGSDGKSPRDICDDGGSDGGGGGSTAAGAAVVVIMDVGGGRGVVCEDDGEILRFLPFIFSSVNKKKRA